MRIERGLTFGRGGCNTPFYNTEQKTQLDLINQTNSLNNICPPGLVGIKFALQNERNTIGSLESLNNKS